MNPKLRIGFIVYRRSQVREGLMYLKALDKRAGNVFVTLDAQVGIGFDSTNSVLYTCLNGNLDIRCKGTYIDQLFLIDDSRMLVKYVQADLISCARDCLCGSCVPEEFQVQEVFW